LREVTGPCARSFSLTNLDDVLLVTSFEGLLYLRQHLAAGIRLGEEGNVEGGESMLRQDLGRVSRHIEDALIGPLLQYLATCGHAIALRHHHIDHEEVDPPAGQAQHIDGFDPGVGFEDPKALLREDPISNSA
jgi:hypothetical protein